MIDSDRDAYLARLGVEAEPPSVEGLVRLHRAHVERIPWETLWIHLGEPWSLDVDESVRRIGQRGRGGYCFHLNGAFGELLSALGYSVVRHVGGVHGPTGPSTDELTNHLVLTVHGLETSENPSGVWYVDAGLGDALHEPLPLLPGVYRQGPHELVLRQTPDGEVGDWHLAHDPVGAFTGMAWRAQRAPMTAFEERHRWLSTAPESGFVQVLTVQRRDADGADMLRGLTLRRVGTRPTNTTLGSSSDLFDALRTIFGIDLAAIEPAALDALWDRTQASHLAWEAAGRP